METDMRNSWQRLATLASLFAVHGLLVPSALAWGPVGHRAVGAVADGLLDPKASAEVARLLAHDLDMNGNPSKRHSLEEVATWADEIRPTPASRPQWHFDDAPACGEIPAGKPWCTGGECASTKIEELSRVLADRSRSERERNEALKWIVHMVGDLHEPLHTATNTYVAGVTDAQDSPTNRGGNDNRVSIPGAASKGPRRLHSAWDSGFVELAFRLVPDQSVPHGAIVRLITQARLLPESRVDATPLDWVKESNELARSVAYDFEGFVCGKPTDDVVVLPSTYVDKATALIPSQLALGGARLARWLNTIIGQSGP